MILCARISLPWIAVVSGTMIAREEVILDVTGALLGLCVEQHLVLRGTK